MIMALYNLQDVLLNFLLIFHTKMRPKYKELFCCPALQLFNCLPPLFCCLTLWKIVKLPEKKLQNATNPIGHFRQLGLHIPSVINAIIIRVFCVVAETFNFHGTIIFKINSLQYMQKQS